MCRGGWKETQPAQVTPADQRDHMTLCSVYKIGRRRREGGHLEWIFCLPKSMLCMTGPCSPGGGRIPASPWEGELIPCFALFLCAAFAFPIKLLYLNP